MGQKVHPIGVRLGITKKSCSHWYAKGRDYVFFLAEDKYLRDYVFQFCRQCMISKIEIERRKAGIRFRISIAQVEFFVGSEGKILEVLRQNLKQKCGAFRSDYVRHFSFSKLILEATKNPEIQIFIRQLRSPEADSQCLTDFIVFELEKRVPFRRVLRIAKERAQNLGQVLGLRLQASGRLNGAEIARTEWVREGRVPLHTFSADLDYAQKVARTAHGLLGIKIWIFRSPALNIYLKLYPISNCFYYLFMLSPKRTKYRKPHRGRLSGRSHRGNLISFGEFGIQSVQRSWLTSRQIESGRRVLTRYSRRGGKLWIRIFPDKRIRIRPAETRMGSGKGNPEYWVSLVYPGTMIFELRGVPESIVRQATRLVGSKLPIKVQFVTK
jgi:large subunit ribosomal protein L16